MALEIGVQLVQGILVRDVQDHLVLVVLYDALVDLLLYAFERERLVDRSSHVRICESVEEIMVRLIYVYQLNEVSILRQL